jgi:uncharacterized protein
MKNNSKIISIIIAISFVVFSVCLYFFYNQPIKTLFTNNTNLNKSQEQSVKKLNLQTVELADTPDLQAKGLMERESLCQNCGMLFVFPIEQVQSFWMENTSISLDMIFIDKSGKVVKIHSNTTPFQRYPTYNSIDPVTYTLEVNAGWSQSNSIFEGDYIDLENLLWLANNT